MLEARRSANDHDASKSIGLLDLQFVLFWLGIGLLLFGVMRAIKQLW
jgi:hypothetical protein